MRSSRMESGFDLPSPVDESDGVSLPFDDATPVEPLLFGEEDLQATAPRGASSVAVAVPAATEATADVSLDADAPAVPDAPDQEG